MSCAAARINTLKSGSVSPMIHVTVLHRCIHANPQKPVAVYIYIIEIETERDIEIVFDVLIFPGMIFNSYF